MKKQFCRFTLLLLVCLLVASTAAAQVEISVVPSATNPAVGYQIEVSINIAGGSNVAGYDFRLTFNSTELEFIGIENSDYFDGSLRALTFDPTELESLSSEDLEALRADVYTALVVGEGAVKFTALTEMGTGEGDGTLAIAKFKVLAEAETTIGLKDVVIGDRAAQPIAVTSITGTTITPTAAGTDIEYRLSIPAGISLIHVPLRVNAVDSVAKTIESVADLYDVLGGTSAVNFLITYDSQTQEWRSFFVPSDKGGPADARLTEDKGIIVSLSTPVSVRLRGGALGINGTSTITLNLGSQLCRSAVGRFKNKACE